MDNPEEQDTKKKTSKNNNKNNKNKQTNKQTNKHTTQYMFDITIRKQTQIRQIRQDPSYKQLEVKTKRTTFLYVSYKQIAYLNLYCNIIK
jgi:heme-binding NEAT domain protein